MKTVRRYFYREILASVGFVSLAFLSLFLFIDLVSEARSVGKGGYSLAHAALYCLLLVPSHFYELAPIAVLIGAIYALARMAQSSEFTIFRTAGLGPQRALRLLSQLGLVFCALTFVVGDYLAPLASETATKLQTTAKGGKSLGRMGIWLKDHQPTPQGERSYSINIERVDTAGRMSGVAIYEFDAQGRPTRHIQAGSAQIVSPGEWTLTTAAITTWPSTGESVSPSALNAALAEGPSGATTIQMANLASMQWKSNIGKEVLSAALTPQNLTTIDLARYIHHLFENEQAAQEYEIQFWKRAFYPLACLVMMSLALPFAYLHARSGGMSYKVFGGIMLGISFVLINNMASHLGMLRDWTPWLVAAGPSILYLLISLAAFSWLVRYR